eukprot:gene19435-22094_t
MGYLTEEQVIFYENNGYLVIERFWDSDTVDKLKEKIHSIVEAADLSKVTSVFSTKEN